MNGVSLDLVVLLEFLDGVFAFVAVLPGGTGDERCGDTVVCDLVGDLIEVVEGLEVFLVFFYKGLYGLCLCCKGRQSIKRFFDA